MTSRVLSDFSNRVSPREINGARYMGEGEKGGEVIRCGLRTLIDSHFLGLETVRWIKSGGRRGR